MGTSGAYTGAGGKAGKEIGEGLGRTGSVPCQAARGGEDDGPESDGTKKPVTPFATKGREGSGGFTWTQRFGWR